MPAWLFWKGPFCSDWTRPQCECVPVTWHMASVSVCFKIPILDTEAIIQSHTNLHKTNITRGLEQIRHCSTPDLENAHKGIRCLVQGRIWCLRQIRWRNCPRWRRATKLRSCSTESDRNRHQLLQLPASWNPIHRRTRRHQMRYVTHQIASGACHATNAASWIKNFDDVWWHWDKNRLRWRNDGISCRCPSRFSLII